MNKIANLDTLRFFAASLVVFQHIELYKASLYTESFWSIPFFKTIGCLGITIFFVLSSFLITTLLLKEKESTGTISFRAFYGRRMLRIWPLYYLIIILGFFILPHISFFQTSGSHDDPGENVPNFLLYFFGLSNMGRTLYGNVSFVSHTWTLATEQIFYLIWPFVILFFDKKLLGVMALIIVLYHALTFFLLTKYAYAVPYSRYMFSFLSGFYIQCMAYGSIFAVLWWKKIKFISILYHPVVFYAAIAMSVLTAVAATGFLRFYYDLYSILFGIIILNLASNPKYSTALENKTTNYLGTISYGIYMFHPIMIVIAIRFALYAESMLIIYFLSFIGAIALSHLSYKYFELYFLRQRWRANRFFKNSFGDRTT